jgi:hypothetical protein
MPLSLRPSPAVYSPLEEPVADAPYEALKERLKSARSVLALYLKPSPAEDLGSPEDTLRRLRLNADSYKQNYFAAGASLRKTLDLLGRFLIFQQRVSDFVLADTPTSFNVMVQSLQALPPLSTDIEREVQTAQESARDEELQLAQAHRAAGYQAARADYWEAKYLAAQAPPDGGVIAEASLTEKEAVYRALGGLDG